MPELNTTFGKYTLVRRLSSGGMAEVYLARQPGMAGFSREVVIKCILEHLSKDEEFLGMFFDEAKLVARLSHPNIVAVHEFGKVDETPYLMMEYVPGINLEELIRGTMGIEPAHALRIASELCAGLDYAHRLTDPGGAPLGIVHRDVSPTNVLLGDDGSVKLIDFGIAKAASQSQRTKAGYFKGRYAYMSPEQARNDSDIDHRVDVHAVGIVLWEMLMGMPLFLFENVYDTIEAVLKAKPRSVLRRYPDIHPEIDEIIARATAKDPAARYQRCSDLQEALDEYAANARLHSSSVALRRYVKEHLSPEGAIGERTPRLGDSSAPARDDRTIPTPSGPFLAEVNVLSSPRKEPSRPQPLAKVAEKADPTIPMPSPLFEAAPGGEPEDEDEAEDATIPLMRAYEPPDRSDATEPMSPELLAELMAAKPDPPRRGEWSRGRGSRVVVWLLWSLLGVGVVATTTAIVLRRDLWSDRVPVLRELLSSLSPRREEAPPRPRPPLKTRSIGSVPPRPLPSNPSPAPSGAEPEARDAAPSLDALRGTFLTLTSEPAGAQLLIDGQETAFFTAIGDLPIDPGAHDLELRLRGHKRWHRAVEVAEGQRLFVQATLQPLEGDGGVEGGSGEQAEFGILSVDSTPPARVLIEGRVVGTTPIEDLELPSGTHQLVFELGDGRRLERSVAVIQGRSTRQRFDLGGSDAGPAER